MLLITAPPIGSNYCLDDSINNKTNLTKFGEAVKQANNS